MARAQQRNFNQAEIEYVLEHGRVLRRTGIRFYFLAERDIPHADLHTPWIQRLVGATLLVDSTDRTLITLYKNPCALKDIKKKAKYRLNRPKAA